MKVLKALYSITTGFSLPNSKWVATRVVKWEDNLLNKWEDSLVSKCEDRSSSKWEDKLSKQEGSIVINNKGA